MKNEKKRYETPEIGKYEFKDEDIMKISKQNEDDDGENWGGFVPFKSNSPSNSKNDWDSNW